MNRRSLATIAAAALVALALAGGGAAVQGKAAATAIQPGAKSQPVGVLVIDELGGAPTAIQGFGFEMTNPASSGGSGGGAGKATLSDVTITRAADSLSPQLFRAGVMGTHLPSVRITLYGSGNAPEAAYLLNDVIVSGFSSADGSERVSFAFKQIDITIGGSHTCFDLATYAAC